MREFAGLATKDYDVVAFAAHGIYRIAADDKKIPTGEIVFNDEYVSASTAIEAIRSAGKTANSATFIISCYRAWKPGDDVDSTVEGFYTRPAWGYVNFGTTTTTVNGVTSTANTSCSAGFNPIGIVKRIGGVNGEPETY